MHNAEPRCAVYCIASDDGLANSLEKLPKVVTCSTIQESCVRHTIPPPIPSASVGGGSSQIQELDKIISIRLRLGKPHLNLFPIPLRIMRTIFMCNIIVP